VRELAAASVNADELYRRTGGNPFFVTEVAADVGLAGVGSPTSRKSRCFERDDPSATLTPLVR